MAQYIDKDDLVAEIERRIKSVNFCPFRTAELGSEKFNEGQLNAYNVMLSFLNTLEVKEAVEEPVSNDLEEASDVYSKVFSDIAAPYIRKDAFIAGAKWQKQQDLIIATELSNFIDKLSKQFPEVSFAKLSRIAVRVAKWQKEQEYTCYEEAFEDGATWKVENLWKSADGDDLPEYDSGVVVFTQDFPNDAGILCVSIAHRPNPDGWDGKSVTTDKVEHYTPQTYGKGGWNIPNVKYWLDVKLPKEIDYDR